jgi:glycosyltransferase involved in cell wall biosynthesis
VGGAVRLKGKKILSIYYKHKPGGLCKRLYMMLTALAEAGGEVHYIAVAPYPISHPRIVPHILWTPFARSEGIFFWFYFLVITPFYACWIGYRFKVDLISVFGAIYGFLAAFMKVLTGKPILTFVRADVSRVNRLLDRAPLLLWMEDFLARIGFKYSDKIITVNRCLKEIVSSRYRIAPEKIGVLTNHIGPRPERRLSMDLCRKELGLNHRDFIVMTAAVLDARKNVDVLIRAGALITAPAVFLVVGDGPEKDRLERLAREVKGKTRFIFPGWQHDLSLYLTAADLFVFTSKHEGCSNALLEALSYDLPCLGSDIEEIREVLAHDALLFRPDDEKDLAEKVSRAIIDQAYLEQIKKCSEESRKKFTFDWERAVVDLHEASLNPAA